jgi:hypothetical protein
MNKFNKIRFIKKIPPGARNSVPEIVAAVGKKWEMTGKTTRMEENKQ